MGGNGHTSKIWIAPERREAGAHQRHLIRRSRIHVRQSVYGIVLLRNAVSSMAVRLPIKLIACGSSLTYRPSHKDTGNLIEHILCRMRAEPSGERLHACPCKI